MESDPQKDTTPLGGGGGRSKRDVEPDDTALLTELQVSERLSLSRKTLYSLRRTGRLGYVMVGASVRYRPSDIRAFIALAAEGGAA